MLIQTMNTFHRARISGITEQFKAAKKNGSQDAIHDLRVEIKRLRAFYELLKEIGLPFSLKKTFGPVRTLFELAAGVRDAQVLQELAREIIDTGGSPLNISEYINVLKQKEMDGIRAFLKGTRGFDLSLLEKNLRIITPLLSKIPEGTLLLVSKTYLDGLFDAILHHKQNEPLEEAALHDLRILCKKTRYTWEALGSCYSRTELDGVDETLKEIHQALGKWHDIDNALHFLHSLLETQDLKPLFSETSYAEFSKALEQKKMTCHQLFTERFRKIKSP